MFLDWEPSFSKFGESLYGRTNEKYAFKQTPLGFGCVKFSEDNVPLSYYDLVYYSAWNRKLKVFDKVIVCSCTSPKKPCKHIQLLRKFQHHCAINTGRQYSPDLDEWYPANIRMEK